jgi:hypothetical protein
MRSLAAARRRYRHHLTAPTERTPFRGSPAMACISVSDVTESSTRQSRFSSVNFPVDPDALEYA